MFHCRPALFAFALISFALVPTLFPVAVPAAGSRESGWGPAGRSGSGPTEKPARDGVSVLLSSDEDGKGIRDGAGEFFRRTGIRVRFTSVEWEESVRLQAMSLAAGKPDFDAVVSDAVTIAEYSKSGKYADLSETLRGKTTMPGGMRSGTAGGYVEGVFEHATAGERVFGLPLASAWTVAFVNNRFLREAGLDPERPPATWQEIVKIGRLLKPRGVYALTDSLKPGAGTTLAFFRWARSAGARVWEMRGDRVYWTLDSRECLDAVLFLRKLLYEGFVDPDVAVRSEGDCLRYFRMSGAAVLPGRDTWYRQLNAALLTEDISASPFPGARPGLTGATARHRFLSIPSTARSPAPARSFIWFITSLEESRRRAIEDGMSPVFRELYADPAVRRSVPADAVLEAAAQCVAEPAMPQFARISGVVSDALQDILVNGRDPGAALSEASRSANRLSGW